MLPASRGVEAAAPAPEDEVEPVPGSDVSRRVPVLSQVKQALANLVLNVDLLLLAGLCLLVLGTANAAKVEVSSLEDAAEAEVKGNIGRVHVVVQLGVLSNLVLNDKAVMRVQPVHGLSGSFALALPAFRHGQCCHPLRRRLVFLLLRRLLLCLCCPLPRRRRRALLLYAPLVVVVRVVVLVRLIAMLRMVAVTEVGIGGSRG